MKESQWNGFDRQDFELLGTTATLVRPKNVRAGSPWVYRAEFFGAFAQVDEALLYEGYHVAHLDLHDQYGCPDAVEKMFAFTHHMEREFSLSPRCVLFGFSRGGLYSVNFAAAHPERVSALYLDAPVLNLLSWPGGLGAAPRGEKEWAECLACYHMTEAQALSFRGHPMDSAARVAAAGIPIISVVGVKDSVVPYDENMRIFAQLYRQDGGLIEVIEKPDCDHHPHSLDDPTPVVEFILRQDSTRG